MVKNWFFTSVTRNFLKICSKKYFSYEIFKNNYENAIHEPKITSKFAGILKVVLY